MPDAEALRQDARAEGRPGDAAGLWRAVLRRLVGDADLMMRGTLGCFLSHFGVLESLRHLVGRMDRLNAYVLHPGLIGTVPMTSDREDGNRSS